MGCADTAQSPVSKRLRIPLEKDLGYACFVRRRARGPGITPCLGLHLS